MSSNVGTPAFKAPEYFQFFEQNKQRKIRYHRNVDVYALGLTYLALLQAKQDSNLRPQIETQQDDSELWVPSIGQLISERIKYKVAELRIVVVEDKGTDITSQIKRIIQKMTAIDPKQRLRAAKLVDALHNVERQSRLSEARETEKRLRQKIPSQNNHKLACRKKQELIEKAKLVEQKLHEKRPSRLQLTVRQHGQLETLFCETGFGCQVWKFSCSMTVAPQDAMCTVVFFNNTCLICGANDIPVLDLWQLIPWVSKPRFIPCWCVFSCACNGFLRFTASATPTDLLMAGIAAEPF